MSYEHRSAQERLMSDQRAMELYGKSADVLVCWRLDWEKHYEVPPDQWYGSTGSTDWWDIAGEIMQARGIKSRWPAPTVDAQR
jgi:hypothetical protein